MEPCRKLCHDLYKIPHSIMEGLLKKGQSLFKAPNLEGSFNLQVLNNTARFLTVSGSQFTGVLAWMGHDSKHCLLVLKLPCY